MCTVRDYFFFMKNAKISYFYESEKIFSLQPLLASSIITSMNHDKGMTKRKNMMVPQLAIMVILTSMNHDKGMTKRAYLYEP